MVLTVKKVAAAPAATAVKKTIAKKPVAEALNEPATGAKPECRWCQKGECFNHGQVPKPGSAEATVQVCRFFAKGECRNGDACTFSHDFDEASLQQIDLCIHWASHGSCKKGDECTFQHDFDREDPEVKKKVLAQKNSSGIWQKYGNKGGSKGWGKGGGFDGGFGGGFDGGGIDAVALGGLLASLLGGGPVGNGMGMNKGMGKQMGKGKGKGKDGCKWCAMGECWSH